MSPRITRRRFLGGAATVGGAAAVVGSVGPARRAFSDPFTDPVVHGAGTDADAYTADDVIYSMCMQCNSFCTIKVRLQQADAASPGAPASYVRKIAGNPYSPLTTQPAGPIPYDTPPADAVAGLGDMPREGRSRSGGRMCLKGQSGVQIAHDARRVTRPLKRVGPRGSGQWRTISWAQAVAEILDGAPDLGTPGLRSWWAYAPKQPVMADWAKVQAGTMTRDAFAARWGEKLIDPDHPDLGPRSNLLAVMGGDREVFVADWLAAQGLGTINRFNHAGVCGGNWVTANVRTHPTDRYTGMYADLDGCECLIVWGTEPLTANKAPSWLAPRISNALARGMKLIVIDPRQSKTAEKAHQWVPVRPGHDTELALGLARWIVDHDRHDVAYLRQPGARAAAAAGEPTWSDATHLVLVDDKTQRKLRAHDLTGAPAPAADAPGPQPSPVVLVAGRPVLAEQATGPADLVVDTTLTLPGGPARVRSVFSLVLERLQERSVAEYAEAAGVSEQRIAALGTEFTGHGKRAAIMSYRGPGMHANGFDAVRAINLVTFLIGNADWKGGQIGARASFSPLQGRYDLVTAADGLTPWGLAITREKGKYEQSTLFSAGYPATRRWYPFGANLIHEVLPSAAARYPYALKALFIHRHSPVDSSPGGARNAAVLRDPAAVALVVSFDLEVGDTSQYADYVLPDVSYLERWGFQPIQPNQPHRVAFVGQPTTRAFDGPRPVEQTYLELIKAMGLPAAGAGAVTGGGGIERPDDFYLKIVANIAYAGKTPVPDASPEELATFTRARQKALGAAYDEVAWQAAVHPEEWPKVVYVLNRGGRFEPPGQEYEGEWLRYRYGGECAFYDEKAAVAKDSLTGKPFGRALPVVSEPVLGDGTPVAADPGPLHLVSWKARQHGTHRTVSSAWLREVRPTNYLWLNPEDARPRGIATGDRVRVRSASGEVEGEALVTAGIRPGVVGADFSYGQQAYGARPMQIDGTPVPPVRRYGNTAFPLGEPLHEESGLAGDRGTGFLLNDLVRDDVLAGGGGCSDPLAGAAAQLDTRVEVLRA